jgi:hypothetical protein
MYITNDKWHCGGKGQHVNILINVIGGGILCARISVER